MASTEAGVRDEFFESMLGDFLDESAELLDGLNENLLQLDEWVNALNEGDSGNHDPELLNEMFRAAHSFKGLSAMLGLTDINRLTHTIENVFDAARNDKIALEHNVVELIFKGVDRLVAMVELLKNPNLEQVDYESVVETIEHLLESAGAKSERASQDDAENALAAVETSAPTEATTVVETPTETTGGDKLATEPDEFSELSDDEEISDKYLSIFIDETDLSLENLTELLLSGGDEKRNEALLVICHRIKGSAASIGLNRAAKLSHFMEDLLQELQSREADLTPGMVDAMLQCTDALRSYVDALKAGNPGPDELGAAYLELRRAASSPNAERPTEDFSPVGDVPAAVGSEEVSDAGPETSDALDATSQTLDATSPWSADAPLGSRVVTGTVRFEANLPLVGLKAQLVHDRLCDLGKLLDCTPSEEQLDELQDLENLQFILASEESDEEIAMRLRMDGVRQVDMDAADHTPAQSNEKPEAEPKQIEVVCDANDVEPTAPELPIEHDSKPTNAAPAIQTPAAAQPPKAAGESRNKPAETLRVDIERLDQLMNLAGQLVINKARFVQIGEGLKHLMTTKQAALSLDDVFSNLDRITGDVERAGGSQHGQVDLERLRTHTRRIRSDLETVQHQLAQISSIRNSVTDLSDAVHQLDRVSDGIQKSVMDTRMVPIGPLFTRFKRVIRDITRSNGKDIHLDIRGEKTELDKRMIDELGDPLIHMVRNCADHGIESPEARLAAGKPRHGTVKLNAFHRGNSIVIQVTDDGKGLDPEKIRAKAVERGIASQADVEKLTPHQVYQLIWEPGFSTAEKVTEVSGRGMGMDIVRTKIEEINGSIDLDSVPGEGTTISIKLPLTLAILPSLLAEIDGDIFAVPVESVFEIVRIKDEDLATVHGIRTACIRGRVISVVDLANIFTWNRPPGLAAERDSGETSLVIVGSGDQRAGVIVHQLLGEQDIVIKSMAENYRNVEGIAGASILGDGRVSLILDVAALLHIATQTGVSAESSVG